MRDDLFEEFLDVGIEQRLCDSLMNTAQVVCIDHSEACLPGRPTAARSAITVSVRSTISMRSLVSTSMVSATTTKPPALAELVFATGVSRTVTTELLDISTILERSDASV